MINFHEYTSEALNRLNINQFTKVQEEVMPHVSNHEDVYAISPTGSGKTYAYLLPLLDKLELQGKGKHFCKVMILAPTRELCIQITYVIREVLKNREGIRTTLLTGGYDIQKQIKSNKNGSDIIVGTPSRVSDHLRRHTIKPKQLETVVIDEVDMMLSMGFEEDIQDCLSYLNEHQTLLFSATETKQTEALSLKLCKDPFIIRIQEETYLKQDTNIQLVNVKENQKIDVLEEILKKSKQTIVFCNTRKTCDFLTDLLKKRDYSIDTIHSEMDYSKRKKIMESFRDNTLKILCATDVASRGIDIPSVHTVIIYDLPDTKEQLIHKVGRTSRAKTKGNAYIFVTNKEKNKYDFEHLF